MRYRRRPFVATLRIKQDRTFLSVLLIPDENGEYCNPQWEGLS
jgi:hypothetical protein